MTECFPHRPYMMQFNSPLPVNQQTSPTAPLSAAWTRKFPESSTTSTTVTTRTQIRHQVQPSLHPQFSTNRQMTQPPPHMKWNATLYTPRDNGITPPKIMPYINNATTATSHTSISFELHEILSFSHAHQVLHKPYHLMQS